MILKKLLVFYWGLAMGITAVNAYFHPTGWNWVGVILYGLLFVWSLQDLKKAKKEKTNG